MAPQMFPVINILHCN